VSAYGEYLIMYIDVNGPGRAVQHAESLLAAVTDFQDVSDAQQRMLRIVAVKECSA
jgi:hypothetical protein